MGANNVSIIVYFLLLIYVIVHIVMGFSAVAVTVFCFRWLKRSNFPTTLNCSCRILLVGVVAVVEALAFYIVMTGVVMFDYHCCNWRVNYDSSIVDVRRVFGKAYEESDATSDATFEQIKKMRIRLRDDLKVSGWYAKKYSHRIVKSLSAYVIYDDKNMVAEKIFYDFPPSLLQ